MSSLSRFPTWPPALTEPARGASRCRPAVVALLSLGDLDPSRPVEDRSGMVRRVTSRLAREATRSLQTRSGFCRIGGYGKAMLRKQHLRDPRRLRVSQEVQS